MFPWMETLLDNTTKGNVVNRLKIDLSRHRSIYRISTVYTAFAALNKRATVPIDAGPSSNS